ncbi:GntR family transcriptional regulator [Opitutaceae bacterium TAV5]|nr:GntR family transcriptional regulator [Opitutaceae bacterium TAV5]
MKSVSFRYRQIFETLFNELGSGVFRPGQKMPSEADLVKRFGVSRVTVGRALRELQLQGLVERRAGSGTYARAGAASGFTFGLIVPDLFRGEIFEPICRGLAEAPRAANHVLLWGHGATDASAEDRSEQALNLCAQYINRRVSGVFFCPVDAPPPEDRVNEQVLAALEKARIPVVLLDRDCVPYPRRTRHDLVGIDHRRVAHRAAKHLIDLGARRIAFAAYTTPAESIRMRIAGYADALKAAGPSMNAPVVVTLDQDTPQRNMEALRNLEVEGLVCANDPTAGLAMHGLRALGKRVPRDVRIVGIDDVRYAALLPVPLTTLRQPCREIGIAAMSAMLERLVRPDIPARDILLECPLIVRDSCGAKKAPGHVSEETIRHKASAGE